MFNIYHKPLKYKEFTGLSPSNTPMYANETTILGLRTKGNIKVIHTEDGDEVTCSIVYRTAFPLVPKSLLEGREIIECVPINALFLSTGYLCYVK